MEREIVSLLLSIPIHTREQDFSCTEGHTILRPLHNIFARGSAAAMNEYLVSAWHCRIGPGIDSQHNTFRSKLRRTCPYQFTLLTRPPIHRTLFAPHP